MTLETPHQYELRTMPDAFTHERGGMNLGLSAEKRSRVALVRDIQEKLKDPEYRKWWDENERVLRGEYLER